MSLCEMFPRERNQSTDLTGCIVVAMTMMRNQSADWIGWIFGTVRVKNMRSASFWSAAAGAPPLVAFASSNNNDERNYNKTMTLF